jgi:serine/threonine protein kinase
MLFEMIAGVPPFEAEVVIALLTMHATAEVPRFRDVAPRVRVPPEVEAMIRRGLEKNKEDRIQSAVEYIGQIDDALSRESVAPDSPPSQSDWEGPGRPSWIEGIESVRTKGQELWRAWAPVVARAITEVQATAKQRSRKEILGVGAGVFGLLALLFVAFGSGRLDAYILDLKDGNTCEERKEAVANLRALGDKRAIPALREAKRARPAGLLRRKANSNTCLRADAAEAVRYLETL